VERVRRADRLGRRARRSDEGAREHHHHRPPPAGDASGANAAVSDASKVASYASAQHDRRAEIESIISNALAGSTAAASAAATAG
jgi:hypothetical protein